MAKITDEKDPLYKYTPQYYLSKGLVPAYHFEGVNYERERGSDGKPKMVNGQYVYPGFPKYVTCHLTTVDLICFQEQPAAV